MVKELEEGYIITYDIGTEGTKTTLVTTEGKTIISRYKSYGVNYTHPGWAEQNPDDWWRAICKTTRNIVAESKISPKSIIAICASSQMLGVVPVDSNGKPTRPAIIWLDTRAGDDEIDEYLERFDYDLVGLLNRGVIPPTCAKDPGAKIIWIKNHEPQVFERSAKIVDVKDYILYRLTGEFYTDYSCASLTNMFNCKNRKWEEDAVKAVGLTVDNLSTPVESTKVIGNLRDDAAEELSLTTEVKVVCGCGDAPAAGVGSGAVSTGKAHIYIGTSAWIGVHLEKLLFDTSGIGTICSADPNKYFLIGEMENAGGCLTWFKNNVAEEESYAELDRIADKVSAGSEKLIFMPWLLGERAPIQDTSIRGGFVNLSRSHARGHMARAILEGVAYHMRWIVDTIEELGIHIDSLNACGGGAKSDVWMQIFSDILNKPVRQVENPQEAGTVGVALIASVGMGIFKSLDDAERHIKIRTVFEPNHDNVSIYNEMYDKFKRIYEKLSPICKTLNR